MASNPISGFPLAAAVDGTEEIPANQSGTKKLTTAQIETYIIEGDNNTGTNQCAIGPEAGDNNSGNNQTAVGFQSGINNAQNNNTSVGSRAGADSTGSESVYIGRIAGYNSTGDQQTAVGYASGQNNSGFNQCALGYQSGEDNTGNRQVAIGQRAGHTNSGQDQTTVGDASGARNSGNNQTAVGCDSGVDNTGDHNTNIGCTSGTYIADGSTANTTSSQSVYIGSQTKSKQVTTTNEIVIGYDAIGEGDNSVVLGNDSINKTILKGNVGIGTTSPGEKLEVDGGIKATNGNIKLFSESDGNQGISLYSQDSNRQLTIYGYLNSYTRLQSDYTQLFDIRNNSEGASTSFATRPIGGTATERMRITSVGNVGIGTATPSEKLEVDGTIKATDINFTGLSTYADDTAAGTGGLVAGDVYKTSTGELRIKL